MRGVEALFPQKHPQLACPTTGIRFPEDLEFVLAREPSSGVAGRHLGIGRGGRRLVLDRIVPAGCGSVPSTIHLPALNTNFQGVNCLTYIGREGSRTDRAHEIFLVVGRSRRALTFADGGHVIGAGSRRPDGSYLWDGCSIIADAPDWLLELVIKKPQPAATSIRILDGIAEGTRNATLTSLAGTMRRRGMSAAAISAALLAENAARCQPPLPDPEILAIAASVARYSIADLAAPVRDEVRAETLLRFKTAADLAREVPIDPRFVIHGYVALGCRMAYVVRAAIARCKEVGAETLLVDTLRQFAGLRGDAENNSGDALRAIEPLQRAAAEGLAVIVDRHERKGGGEVGESGRGSSAFAGAVDILLSLRRPEGRARATMRVLHALSRFRRRSRAVVASGNCWGSNGRT
jgi:hypothetical protein